MKQPRSSVRHINTIYYNFKISSKLFWGLIHNFFKCSWLAVWMEIEEGGYKILKIFQQRHLWLLVQLQGSFLTACLAKLVKNAFFPLQLAQ